MSSCDLGLIFAGPMPVCTKTRVLRVRPEMHGWCVVFEIALPVPISGPELPVCSWILAYLSYGSLTAA